MGSIPPRTYLPLIILRSSQKEIKHSTTRRGFPSMNLGGEFRGSAPGQGMVWRRRCACWISPWQSDGTCTLVSGKFFCCYQKFVTCSFTKTLENIHPFITRELQIVHSAYFDSVMGIQWTLNRESIIASEIMTYLTLCLQSFVWLRCSANKCWTIWPLTMKHSSFIPGESWCDTISP